MTTAAWSTGSSVNPVLGTPRGREQVHGVTEWASPVEARPADGPVDRAAVDDIPQSAMVGAIAHTCPVCEVRSAWPEWFCPRCDAHDDALYIADSRTQEPMTREEIVAEYRACGRHDEADRIVAQGPRPANIRITAVIERRERIAQQQRPKVSRLIDQLGGPARVARLLGVSVTYCEVIERTGRCSGFLRRRLEKLAREDTDRRSRLDAIPEVAS